MASGVGLVRRVNPPAAVASVASPNSGDGTALVRFDWPAIGREQLAGARALLAEGHYDEAVSVLRFLVKRFAGMTVGTAAARQLLAVGG